MLVHGFPRKFPIKETAFSSALKGVTDQTSEMPDRMSEAWVNKQHCPFLFFECPPEVFSKG